MSVSHGTLRAAGGGSATRRPGGGGREALVRLVVLAVAVGLGVGLLLIAVAGINAVNAQNDRYAWLDTAGTSQTRQSGPGPAGTHHESAPPASPSRAPAWLLVTTDEFGRQDITRVDLAATGPSSPVPPGIPADPARGSTTSPRRWPPCCAPPRRTSSRTAIPARWPVSSARRACPRRASC